ncbi:MAG: hypothetical protein LBT00_01935 [Spirochaetaceae bacterium]|jgi:hypothetical protein|nr:hypothetical protein [Spirochaetaceae bacterium]
MPIQYIGMTDKEKQLAEKYPEAAIFAAIAESVWQGSKATVKMELQVTGKLRAELQRLLGTDVHTLFVTDSDIRHIKKQHGKGEASRGQIDVTPDDIALIPIVLNEFDTAEHTETDRRGNKKILFKKRIDETVYLATIERGPHKGEIRTLWKTP